MPLSLGSRLCGKNPGGPLSIALYLSLTHLSGASACYLSLLIYLPPARPPLSIAPYLSLLHLSGLQPVTYRSLSISPWQSLAYRTLSITPSPIWGAAPNPATYFHTHYPWGRGALHHSLHLCLFSPQSFTRFAEARASIHGAVGHRAVVRSCASRPSVKTH